MKTTKPLNYLAHSHHEFTDYHTETADKIYQLIEEEKFEELGILNKSIPEKEATYVHYAYLDKYGYGWKRKIQKIVKSFEELVKLGLV